MLWPERQSPIADRVNAFVDRGAREGLNSGDGNAGFHPVLGGMRTGQGVSGGIGYRVAGLWRDRLSLRGTARGTLRPAYMFDFDVDVKGLSNSRRFVNWYSKLEHSPDMVYYGQGSNSPERARAKYRLRDVASDVNLGFEPWRTVRVGFTTGFLHANIGQLERENLLELDESVVSAETPGIGDETNFFRFGAFVALDRRDLASGAHRGSFFGARFRRFEDLDANQFSFRQTEFEFQHYVPYANEGRVIAVRAASVLSFPATGHRVPVYLQPTAGGNDDLRGFAWARFHDNHALYISVEHRWHVFPFLDGSVFMDAGKVVAERSDISLLDLRYSGGIGFRVRLIDAVVVRMDLGRSKEGFRAIFTFSDVFKAPW